MPYYIADPARDSRALLCSDSEGNIQNNTEDSCDESRRPDLAKTCETGSETPAGEVVYILCTKRYYFVQIENTKKICFFKRNAFFS